MEAAFWAAFGGFSFCASFDTLLSAEVHPSSVGPRHVPWPKRAYGHCSSCFDRCQYRNRRGSPLKLSGSNFCQRLVEPSFISANRISIEALNYLRLVCFRLAFTQKPLDMKLLIVDDHPVLRDGLAALLLQLGPDTTVLQARDASEGIALVESHIDLDVIILDLAMPGMKGLQALSEFGHKRPDLPVIVLSSSEDPRDVRQALASGALGYVPKSASQQVLLSAVRLVLNGDLYIPPLILDDPSSAIEREISGADGSRDRLLTARQIEILILLSEGKPNKTIAAALTLSEKTVKAHISAIFKTLNVVNRTQAAIAGRKAGII
jgi:two-component system nitrate/nitrite response regulator NarL